MRLGIISGAVSAGGGERFLHGLVSGLLLLPEVADWRITVILPRYNTAGARVVWPSYLVAPNIEVKFLWDDPIGRAFSYLNASGDRFWGIPGTSFLRYHVPHLLARRGPDRLQGLAGNAQVEVELCVRREGFDVAYFVWPHGEDCPRLDVPLVMTVHDLHFKHGIGSPAFMATKDRQIRDWLGRCAAFVVPSEAILEEFQAFYRPFVSKGRAIRHGIPQHPTMPTPAASEAYRRDKGLPERFLLCPGWITPHKNQAVLFEALGRLRAKGESVPVVCVGPNSSLLWPERARDAGPSSDYVQEVLALARAAGLEWQRDYYALGYVQDLDMEHLYRLASALVMPTLYEGGGLPVIEAMRAGCPVICSKIAALAEEVAQVDGSAVLFDPHSPDDLALAIERTLRDREATQRRANRAQELVAAAYNWEQAAGEYVDVFREASGLYPAQPQHQSLRAGT